MDPCESYCRLHEKRKPSRGIKTPFQCERIVRHVAGINPPRRRHRDCNAYIIRICQLFRYEFRTFPSRSLKMKRFKTSILKNKVSMHHFLHRIVILIVTNPNYFCPAGKNMQQSIAFQPHRLPESRDACMSAICSLTETARNRPH